MDKKVKHRHLPNLSQMKQITHIKEFVFVDNETPLDSYTKKLIEYVLKWLNDRLEGKQNITVKVNNFAGSNPPGNPSNINIVNVIMNCPHAQNCPYDKPDDSKQSK